MILDEPTNGLDPAGIKEFRDLLRHLAHQRGLSVMVSSHILQEMQLMCDTVGIINNGELLRVGTIEELLPPEYRQHLPLLPAAHGGRRPPGPAAHLSDRLVGVGPDFIDLHIAEEEVGNVNCRFMENGITIYGLAAQGNSLEQIFMSITGEGTLLNKLLQNERTKLYKKVSTWILMGVIVGVNALHPRHCQAVQRAYVQWGRHHLA